MATRTFVVHGMTCGNCERHVREAATRVPGVSHVEVDRPGESARVTYDEAMATPDAVAAAITEAGYPASARP